MSVFYKVVFSSDPPCPPMFRFWVAKRFWGLVAKSQNIENAQILVAKSQNNLSVQMKPPQTLETKLTKINLIFHSNFCMETFPDHRYPKTTLP